MKNKLEVGQIRKLDSIKGFATSRLVVIAEIDQRDATCLVFLLNNMSEAATPRDLCISKLVAKSKYEIVLMTDYLSRADQARLVNNEILGVIDPLLINRIREISFASPFGGLVNNFQKLGVTVGGYPAQKYDSVWLFRDNEFDNFSRLTFVRNPISLDYAVKFYVNNKNNVAAFMSEEVPLDALRFFAISQSRIEVAA
jgi:hypothetical protein